jgi:transforming growth factor-beta-induced protein
MKNFKNLTYSLALGAMILVASSCQKEDVLKSTNGIQKQNSSRVAIEEPTALTALDGSDAKALKKTEESIAEIAINNNFNELVTALSYVDSLEGTALVDLFLNGTDQYTVFAPADSAFFNLYDALGADDIYDIPSATVLNVLLYHVTEGRRAANSVVPKKKPRNIETLLGSSFSVNPDLSIDAINSTAKITAANFSASNGVVHVIDAVLLPEL